MNRSDVMMGGGWPASFNLSVIILEKIETTWLATFYSTLYMYPAIKYLCIFTSDNIIKGGGARAYVSLAFLSSFPSLF